MTESLRASEILQKIAGLRVAVFGDFCLDAYWSLDEGEREFSVETGLPLQRVREQRYSLGGAGNVAANLVDLGICSVKVVGLAGADLFGQQLASLLRQKNIAVEGLLHFENWQTMVYAKPMHSGREGNRFDFGAFNQASTEMQRGLLDAIRNIAAESDVLVLNQQVPGSVSAPAFIAALNDVLEEFPQVLLVADARHFANAYRHAVLKLNAEEAARFLGERCPSPLSLELACEWGTAIHTKTQKPVFLTRGEEGIVVAESRGVSVVPGLKTLGPVDPVGAGDTVVSAIAAALGSGQDPVTAARLANVAAMITVQKLNTTGTASPDEILDALRSHEGALTVETEGASH